MGIVNNYEQIREKTVAIVGVGGVGSGLYFAVTTLINMILKNYNSNYSLSLTLRHVFLLNHFRIRDALWFPLFEWFCQFDQFLE